MTAIVYDYADINARLMNGFREPVTVVELQDEISKPVDIRPVCDSDGYFIAWAGNTYRSGS